MPERLPLFTQHVAPVTIAWFNAFATTGLPGFDYIVGDERVAYDGEERFFTERILRLPMSYLTFEVTHPAPPLVPPPCLQNRYLTFGSLVAQYKITPPVLDAWAEILRRTDGTRLLLANTALRSIHNRQLRRRAVRRAGRRRRTPDPGRSRRAFRLSGEIQPHRCGAGRLSRTTAAPRRWRRSGRAFRS